MAPKELVIRFTIPIWRVRLFEAFCIALQSIPFGHDWKLDAAYRVGGWLLVGKIGTK